MDEGTEAWRHWSLAQSTAQRWQTQHLPQSPCLPTSTRPGNPGQLNFRQKKGSLCKGPPKTNQPPDGWLKCYLLWESFLLRILHGHNKLLSELCFRSPPATPHPWSNAYSRKDYGDSQTSSLCQPWMLSLLRDGNSLNASLLTERNQHLLNKDSKGGSSMVPQVAALNTEDQDKPGHSGLVCVMHRVKQ